MPVTVLRAAVVVGHGGISWEITRQLVDRLPAMIAPRWVNTRTQPIALPDVIRYLVGVLDAPQARGQVYEVGGPEVLRYVDMMRARRRHPEGPRPAAGRRAVAHPAACPRCWLALVTDVDRATARNLIDSMTSEVVVHDTSIRDVVPGRDDGLRRRGAAGARRAGARAAEARRAGERRAADAATSDRARRRRRAGGSP